MTRPDVRMTPPTASSLVIVALELVGQPNTVERSPALLALDDDQYSLLQHPIGHGPDLSGLAPADRGSDPGERVTLPAPGLLEVRDHVLPQPGLLAGPLDRSPLLALDGH